MIQKKSSRQSRKGTKTDSLEHLLQIKRVVKVVRGGRRFKLRVLMIVGDGEGNFGFAIKKGDEVMLSAEKAVRAAYKNMIHLPRVGTTIPHALTVKYKNIVLQMKPSRDTGIIANKVVRSIMRSAGVSDVVCKTHGSHNPINITRAVVKASQSFLTLEEVKRLRGKEAIVYRHIQNVGKQ
jgi:small subunit ribosomal protein S5